MRIGIFGGSFDPVHKGHLRLAECCQQQRRLDQVWFVPAASAPHKLENEQTPGELRAEMLELAIADQAGFKLCRLELDRGGVSYTVDTLADIHRESPEAELFLLLGADSLEDLPNWREPGEICRFATPVVVRRPGCGELDFEPLSEFLPAERVEQIRQAQVAMSELDMSSTDVRARVARGESIGQFVPESVAKFIQSRRLYR